MNQTWIFAKSKSRSCRGQLSVDVLFAIIAAAIFFAVLVNTYNDRLTTQAGEQSTSNEARSILLDVYAAVGTVKAYGQAVDYVSPSLRQKNMGNQIFPCTITVNKPADSAKGYIEVGITGNTGKIDRNYLGIDLGAVNFANPSTGPITGPFPSFPCGTKVIITKAP